MKYRVLFKVYGSGSFPFDMLRYDRCFPYSQEDVARMLQATEPREITMMSYAANKTFHGYPTNDRWKSFGWNVSPTSIDIQRL